MRELFLRGWEGTGATHSSFQFKNRHYSRQLLVEMDRGYYPEKGSLSSQLFFMTGRRKAQLGDNAWKGQISVMRRVPEKTNFQITLLSWDDHG